MTDLKDLGDGVHHTHDVYAHRTKIGVLYSYVGKGSWSRAVESLDGQVRFVYMNDGPDPLGVVIRKNFGLKDDDIIRTHPAIKRTLT